MNIASRTQSHDQPVEQGAESGERDRHQLRGQVVAREGEVMLDEGDVARVEHAPGGAAVTPVATMVRRVAEEDTCDGAEVQLVTRGCGGVRIAEASEHAQKAVVGSDTEEELVRGVR